MPRLYWAANRCGAEPGRLELLPTLRLRLEGVAHRWSRLRYDRSFPIPRQSDVVMRRLGELSK
jgi:hypothetical protein